MVKVKKKDLCGTCRKRKLQVSPRLGAVRHLAVEQINEPLAVRRQVSSLFAMYL